MAIFSVMSTPPITVDHEQSVREAAQAMRENRVGSLLVLKQGEMAGIMTEGDIVHKVVAAGASPAETTAGEIMSEPVITIEPAAALDDAIERMMEHGVKHLVVALEGDVRGVVTVTDIAYAQPDLARQARDHLRTHWEG